MPIALDHTIVYSRDKQEGGRGVSFDDPSGHVPEIITRPYGDER